MSPSIQPRWCGVFFSAATRRSSASGLRVRKAVWTMPLLFDAVSLSVARS